MMGNDARLILFCIFSTALISFASGNIGGRVMAFVDINADCFTDLVTSGEPNSIAVYVASDKEPVFKEDERFRHQFPNDTFIMNLGVGDFDGDSFPDLVVSLASSITPPATKSPTCESSHHVEICYGKPDGFTCVPLSYEPNGTVATFCEQPLILDCNVDGNNDLLTTVETSDGRLRFACFQATEKRGSFDLISPFPVGPVEFSPAPSPTFNAFVDITGDLNPEIVLWTTNKTESEHVGLQVLQLVADKRWVPLPGWMPGPHKDNPKLYSKPSSAGGQLVFGQSVYDDFNKDGMVDQVMPMCVPDDSGECRSVHFYVWTKGHWNSPIELVLVDGEHKQQWTVLQDPPSRPGGRPTFHVRSGDYTQDGYPDLLVVLKQGPDSGNGSRRAAFLLENAPCAAGQVCSEWNRTFIVSWAVPFRSGRQGAADLVSSAAFFDLGEDGTLDVLLEYQKGQNQREWTTDFVASAYEGDTTFLKIQVFTPSCLDKCRNTREGSAISLPGAALLYTSSDTDGNPIRGAYSQRSITSYRPLLLPYALFGLGRTPNFVEKLQVGAPSWPQMNKTWEQLVPNSRIYVIPYPLDEPWKWLHRLYLTPNRLIIYSFISLSSVCGLIIIIVFGLHMQERRMDKKERELQREKFHFDAM